MREDTVMRTLTISRLLAAVGAVTAAFGVLDRAAAQDTGAAARYGVVNLSANFRPDPHTVTVQAGGGDSAANLGSGCAGYISNERADYELNYTSGSYSLGIYVLGSVDTTLVVNDPAGKWFCNDDFGGRSGTNPGLVFQSPASGSYDIWVGSYEADGTGEEVSLVITETNAPWDPLYGAIELSANFNPDPHVVEIVAIHRVDEKIERAHENLPPIRDRSVAGERTGVDDWAQVVAPLEWARDDHKELLGARMRRRVGAGERHAQRGGVRCVRVPTGREVARHGRGVPQDAVGELDRGG